MCHHRGLGLSEEPWRLKSWRMGEAGSAGTKAALPPLHTGEEKLRLW